MNIYFSASIRAGQELVQVYAELVEYLKQYGTVLTEFVRDKSLTTYGHQEMSEEEIFTKDTAMLETADVVVAEVTTASLGVGYEIGIAEKMNKKILCLYHEEPDKSLSAMIAGNPACIVKQYNDITEAKKRIDEFFTTSLSFKNPVPM